MDASLRDGLGRELSSGRHTASMAETTSDAHGSVPIDPAGTLLRLAAFTADPAGGNPAGVWIGTELPPAPVMQRVAAEVGFSETAFLAPDGSGLPGRFRVRYFSPLAE